MFAIPSSTIQTNEKTIRSGHVLEFNAAWHNTDDQRRRPAMIAIRLFLVKKNAECACGEISLRGRYKHATNREDGAEFSKKPLLRTLLRVALYAQQGLRNCRASVCVSVRPSHRCGGFAAVGPAARRYRSIAARPALSSKCEQCRVASRRRKLNTDLFTFLIENDKHASA